MITTCGRICYQSRKINVSQVFAGQKVGLEAPPRARDQMGRILQILQILQMRKIRQIRRSGPVRAKPYDRSQRVQPPDGGRPQP